MVAAEAPNQRVHPSLGSFRVNRRGYQRLNAGPYVDEYLHRAVWMSIARRDCECELCKASKLKLVTEIPVGHQIHHQGPKSCYCPEQLICLPPELHPPHMPLRDPYTGQFLTLDEYRRRYESGEGPPF